ncbi:hypothetical protein [Legionella maioricensis]|uniref:Uncharacterized protein n=1 Tax=Legionella maioricensis TaxID=2896528 RepID=A0A9X2CXU4_9GAMM|nr:hypothetical protein [Legionella maioricensis]MCL9682736.1 hypothetical protein [Legionella maioricensis]MCL9687216.1 hypothetical protein [Legionella maioricensis]
MKFEWELIEKNERNQKGGGTPYTYRAKIIGGWLVKHTTDQGVSLVFVPDPEYKWIID